MANALLFGLVLVTQVRRRNNLTDNYDIHVQHNGIHHKTVSSAQYIRWSVLFVYF